MILTGDFSKSVSAEDLIKGITEMKIRIDIAIEHIGSAMYHPKYFIRRDDIMTPREPRASARIWRKTP